MSTLTTTSQQSSSKVMTLESIIDQSRRIDALLKSYMTADVHYGVIPGTKKPSLLQPGAEKIALLLGICAKYEFQRDEYSGNHREYTVTASFYYRDGSIAGQGIGSCSTLERKYRYRSENTGIPVPAEYWDHNRDTLYLAEQLGYEGPGHNLTVKKTDGKWVIYQQTENSDIADQWNTALKMARKRAFIDGVRSIAGISDMFEQPELYEDPDNYKPDHVDDQPTGRKYTEPKSNNAAADKPINQNQMKTVLAAISRNNAVTEKSVCDFAKVGSLNEIQFSNLNSVLEWIKNQK